MIEIQDNEFREWVDTALSRFETMVLTMIDVAELIKANTNWRVPLDTGRLESSFMWTVKEDSLDSIIVEAGYSVTSGKSSALGFEEPEWDYAFYQHQGNFNHPKRGERFYLYNGIKASRSMAYQMIETDYMSLFGRFKGGY